MQDIGPAVTLGDMLSARDSRAERQRALLDRFGVPLICFTLNMPGPVKRSPLVDRGFGLGITLILRQLQAAGLKPVHWETHHPVTGSEGYLAVDTDALQLKRVILDIEQHTPAGRLFDMDVLDRAGRKVTRQQAGLPERTCLVCDAPAHACARSRAHDPDAVIARAREILSAALEGFDAQTIAQTACRALLYEACTTPKPGLVDMRNSGSHRDMNLFHFMASASALWPYFEACARAGMDGRAQPPPGTLKALRPLGRLAEGAMLGATGGINTHKGAVFTLGVLCAVLGRLEPSERQQPEAVMEMAAAIAHGISAELNGITIDNARTAGERMYAHTGNTGARGQLEAGLPAVRAHGLPALEQALEAGRTLNDAGCLALLHLIAHNDDTNLFARGGADGQTAAREAVLALLSAHPMPDADALADLDAWFIRRNLSPGGSADLLAACYLLHFMREDPLRECNHV